MKNNALRSIGAIVAGLLFIRVLTFATNTLLAKAGIVAYQFDQNSIWTILLMFLYQTTYKILASYLAAKLAPKEAMAHAMAVGGINLALSLISVIYIWNVGSGIPPSWYSILSLVLILPCAWLGGKLSHSTPHPFKQY